MNWILLRGLSREAAHWGAFPARLQRALGAVSVHCIDLPGNGRFHRQLSPWTLRGYTRHVIEQTRGIAPPYGVVGLSLGGMVALDWAQQTGPDTVSALVLINTSTGFSPFHQRAVLDAWPKLFQTLLPLSLEFEERIALALVSNLHADDPGLLQSWVEIQRTRPVQRTNVLRQLIAAAGYRPDDRPPACPALLLASAQDRLVDPACSDILHRRWGWPLERHPTAGHDLPMDDPDWVIEKIVAFAAADVPSTNNDPVA